MLTYTKRELLAEEVGVVSPEDMEQVEYIISRELSIREHIVAERDVYKKMYEELLAKTLGEN